MAKQSQRFFKERVAQQDAEALHADKNGQDQGKVFSWTSLAPGYGKKEPQAQNDGKELSI